MIDFYRYKLSILDKGVDDSAKVFESKSNSFDKHIKNIKRFFTG